VSLRDALGLLRQKVRQCPGSQTSLRLTSPRPAKGRSREASQDRAPGLRPGPLRGLARRLTTLGVHTKRAPSPLRLHKEMSTDRRRQAGDLGRKRGPACNGKIVAKEHCASFEMRVWRAGRRPPYPETDTDAIGLHLAARHPFGGTPCLAGLSPARHSVLPAFHTSCPDLFRASNRAALHVQRLRIGLPGQARQ